MFRIFRHHGLGKVEKVEKSKCFALFDIMGLEMSKKSKSRNVSHFSTSWAWTSRKSRKVEACRTFRYHGAGHVQKVEKSQCFALFDIMGQETSNKSKCFAFFDIMEPGSIEKAASSKYLSFVDIMGQGGAPWGGGDINIIIFNAPSPTGAEGGAYTVLSSMCPTSGGGGHIEDHIVFGSPPEGPPGERIEDNHVYAPAPGEHKHYYFQSALFCV